VPLAQPVRIVLRICLKEGTGGASGTQQFNFVEYFNGLLALPWAATEKER